jgi:hypothetical protein
MEGFAYFPAIIYRDERPDLIDSVLPTSIQYLEQARKPGNPVCQTAHLSKDPVFQEIENYLLLSSVNLLSSQGYSVEKYDFYLQGFWLQEINKGGGTDVHVHKNSQVCGWFFIETPEQGSYPVYYDTRSNKSMIELDYLQGDEVTNATNTIHFNSVVPGTVLFGNSWIRHQLSMCNAVTPTRCIHFIISHKERMCTIY